MANHDSIRVSNPGVTSNDSISFSGYFNRFADCLHACCCCLDIVIRAVQDIADCIVPFIRSMQRGLVVTVIAVLRRGIREGFGILCLQVLVRAEIVSDNNPYKFSREVIQGGVIHNFRSVFIHDLCLGIRVGISGEVIVLQTRRYAFLLGYNHSLAVHRCSAGGERCPLQAVPLAFILVGIVAEGYHVDQLFRLICSAEVDHVVTMEGIDSFIIICFCAFRQE